MCIYIYYPYNDDQTNVVTYSSHPLQSSDISDHPHKVVIISGHFLHSSDYLWWPLTQSSLPLITLTK